MIVQVYNQQTVLSIHSDQVVKLSQAVISYEKQACDEVSVHFVETQQICELHETFFNDPSPTDCISFPMDDEESAGYQILGELFVCPQTAKEYADEYGLDPYEETSLYVVHGLLHLMGYDDLEDEDIVEMRAAEERHMLNLKQHQLLLHP